MRVSHGFVVERSSEERGFDAHTVYYSYRVLEPDGREIVAYHWHPEGTSPIRHPHLHLTSRLPTIDLGPRFAPVALAEAHLPTGPVRLADVVRLLIDELGVAPRRTDWGAVLAAAR